jgi:hypothetical protein
VVLALIDLDAFQDRSPRIASQSGGVLRGGPDSCLQKLEGNRGFGCRDRAMEVGSERVSGILIIVGSALFLCAAFSPISSRVFSPGRSATRKLEVIRGSPTAWLVTQILFGLGALVTVIGICVLAYGLGRQPPVWLIWTSVAFLILAVVLWLWHLYGRRVDPVAFAEGRWPRLPFLAYCMLTEMGLAILGYTLLRGYQPTWIGWMLIGSMVLLFVLTLIFRDMPPLMFYLVTLILGIALVT